MKADGTIDRIIGKYATSPLADVTTSFAKNECAKYDNYTRENSAGSLQSLFDSAEGLGKFVPAEDLADPSFLDDFIRSEHVGGVIVFDEGLAPVAQADMDGLDSYELWSGSFPGSASRASSSTLRKPTSTASGWTAGFAPRARRRLLAMPERLGFTCPCSRRAAGRRR